jgi:hypothetical protein
MTHSNSILQQPLKKFYSNRHNLETLLVILNSKNLVKEKQYREKKLRALHKSGTDANTKKIKKRTSEPFIIPELSLLTPISPKLKIDLDMDKKISLRLIDWFVTNYCKKYKICIQNKNSKTHKTEYINIYDSYKSNLKAFSKQMFDPFRRNNRVLVYYNIKSHIPTQMGNNSSIDSYYKLNIINFNEISGKINKNINGSSTSTKINMRNLDTTVGQLNFFKWIIDNNIYQYICKHRNEIEDDMTNSQKINNEKKLDPRNLVVARVDKNVDGSDKIIYRKKRNELSKPKNKKLQMNKSERIVYFD